MNRQLSIGAAALSAVLLAACSGGGSGSGGPPPITPPPVVTQSYTFPAGDAIAGKGIAWDIIGLKTTLSGSGNNALGNSYDMLRVDVTFAQDVSNDLPAPGTPLDYSGNQVGVRVFIDSDGNSSTGNIGVCNQSPPLITPFEYGSDQGNFPNRLPDGNYSILYNNQAIYSGSSNPPAEAVVAISGHTLSYTFNLNTLGVFTGAKAPRIGIAAAAFNSPGQPADCVPTGRAGVTEVYTVPS